MSGPPKINISDILTASAVADAQFCCAFVKFVRIAIFRFPEVLFMFFGEGTIYRESNEQKIEKRI